MAKGKHKIDERQNVVDALALLFRAASGQEHGRVGFAENFGSLGQQSCWYSRNPFDPIWPIFRDSTFDPLEISGAQRNKFVIDQTALDRYVQQAVRERGVGPRRELQVQGGEFCRRGANWSRCCRIPTRTM